MARKEEHLATVECPWCEKQVDVFKEVDIITPAVKADKKVSFLARKVLQTQLEVEEELEAAAEREGDS